MEIQEKLLHMGQSGCYFHCLRKAADQHDSMLIDCYDRALEKGWIEEDCYIKDGVSLLRAMGVDVKKCVKADKYDPAAKVAIALWSRGTQDHFCLWLNNKMWDPLGVSRAMAEGKIKSWRLYY